MLHAASFPDLRHILPLHLPGRITLAGLTLFGPVVVLVILQSFDSALLFATIAFIGVTYSVKILPVLSGKKIIWISLKDIPLLKTIVVSAIWAGASLLLAAITTNNNFFRYDIMVVFATFFVSTFCSTVTSDVKDIEGDRIRKVYTLPVLFGTDATFHLLSMVTMSSEARAQLKKFIDTLAKAHNIQD